MPKISDIQETPNPNAVKFILREPVTNGVGRQFGSPDQAQSDTLAKSLFEVGSVASVFYMDNMITVEKENEADWDELLPALAVPIRAAESAAAANGGNGMSSVGGRNGQEREAPGCKSQAGQSEDAQARVVPKQMTYRG